MTADEIVPEWVLIEVDYDRRGVEWTLWRFPLSRRWQGRRRGVPLFAGDFTRAADLWQAFAAH